jgi:hypothetical protein
MGEGGRGGEVGRGKTPSPSDFDGTLGVPDTKSTFAQFGMQRQQSGGVKAGCWPSGQAAQRTEEQSPGSLPVPVVPVESGVPDVGPVVPVVGVP